MPISTEAKMVDSFGNNSNDENIPLKIYKWIRMFFPLLFIGVYICIAVHQYYNKKKKFEMEKQLQEDMKVESNQKLKSMGVEELLSNETNDADDNGGRTDKYIWTQTENEIEIFIPVPEGTRAKNIVCKFNTKKLKVLVHMAPVIDGELLRSIDAEESTWQIDFDEDKGGNVLWISMRKKVATKKKEHWNCAIVGDTKIDVSKFGPSVRTINTDDPEQMAAMARIARATIQQQQS